MTYEGYVRNRSKPMLTDSYFYPSRQLAKRMMINSCGPARTQTTSPQNMSISNVSVQKIPNLHVCSTDENK